MKANKQYFPTYSIVERSLKSYENSDFIFVKFYVVLSLRGSAPSSLFALRANPLPFPLLAPATQVTYLVKPYKPQSNKIHLINITLNTLDLFESFSVLPGKIRGRRHIPRLMSTARLRGKRVKS